MVGNFEDTDMRGNPSKCPKCGKLLDAATVISQKKAAPKPHDYSVCMYCSAILIFDEECRLRQPTLMEMVDLQTSRSWPMIERAVMATREVQKKMKGAKK